MLHSKKTEVMANFFENKKYVYVLGDVVAIKAKTDGVLILANEEENIEYVDNLREGDNILYIDNQKVNNSQDVYDILKAFVLSLFKEKKKIFVLLVLKRILHFKNF